MERLKTIEKNTLGIAGVVVAVIFFVSLNVFSSAMLTSARLDLTEDRLFTLSEGTKEVLRSIDEPIRLRFYLSKQLTELSPVHANYANRVQEILEHYAGIAGDMLQLEIHHPEPYTAQEDEAVGYGLQGIPVNPAGDKAYFGLVANNSTDDQEIIAFFDPGREQYLEYDLTKLVYTLANPKKTVVGLLSSLPLGADPNREFKPWPAFEQLNQFFTFRSLRGGGPEIADDIDIVLVAHPQRLTEADLYALDQFVLRGGKALVLVDPHLESASTTPQKGPPERGATSSTLGPLFEAWGIEFRTDEVIADRLAAQRVAMPIGGRTTVIDYLPWLRLDDEHFNRDDVITAQISRINMASAGHFRARPAASTSFTPLVVSSREAMRIDVEDVNFIPDPKGLLDRFEAEGEEFVLAARIQGKVKSAYPDGPPWGDLDLGGDGATEGAETQGDGTEGGGTEGAGDKPARAHLAESAGPINVVAIADVDLLVDKFWLQTQNLLGRQVGVPIANNVHLIINILDNLSGSDALISLRSRGLSYRPFQVTEEIRRAAELRYRETEQDLVEKLQETEAKLSDLRQQDLAGGGVMLTSEQKAAIENFRAEMVSLRQQLRDVQHALRKDIESLDTRLKVANIWAMPVLIGLVAVVLALIRRARYRQHLETS